LLKEFLTTESVEINVKNNDGMTALMYASGGGHEACIGLLLEKGAHINEKDNNCMTALMAASAGGHEACIGLLLEKGAF
jgi:ankyrin repeat protein